MNFVIDTESKTITIKESYKIYDMVKELEKRFTKEELDEYSIIHAVPPLFNPWTTLGPPPTIYRGISPFVGTTDPYKVNYKSGDLIEPINNGDGK